MALADLGFNFAAVLARIGRVYVSDDDGTTYYEPGRFKNVVINTAKVVTDPDQQGRIKQQAYDITGQLVLTQTSSVELENLELLLHPSGDGLWVKFTDDVPATGAAGAGAADGLEFKNVLFTAEPSFDMGGGESMIAMEFTGRVSVTGFSALGSSNELSF